MPRTVDLPDRYGEILAQLKQRVHAARLQAHRAVNTELIRLYWDIGRTILKQQGKAGWGGKVVEQLAQDLRREFPDMTGLSRRNLLYMRSFAESWPDDVEANVPQAVAQMPWSHVRLLPDKLDTRALGACPPRFLAKGHPAARSRSNSLLDNWVETQSHEA